MDGWQLDREEKVRFRGFYPKMRHENPLKPSLGEHVGDSIPKCDVFFITKMKILCSRENEFVWDREVQWFFYVQASICRLKNLIDVNLAYNKHLPLL